MWLVRHGACSRDIVHEKVHPDCPNTRPLVYDDAYSDIIDTINDVRIVPVPNGPGLGADYYDYIVGRQTRRVHAYN